MDFYEEPLYADGSARTSPRRKTKHLTDSKSAITRELRKWHFYLKAKDIFNGIRRKYGPIRRLTDQMGQVSNVVCDFAIDTDLGRAADDMLAIGIRQVKVATMKMSNPFPWVCNSTGLAIRYIARTAVRYFPPVLLARWGTDLMLCWCCLFLGILMDILKITEPPYEDRSHLAYRYNPEPLADIYRPYFPCYWNDEESSEEDTDGSPVVRKKNVTRTALKSRAILSAAEPIKRVRNRHEYYLAQMAREEYFRAEAARAESLRAEVARAESLRAEVARAEPLQAEVARDEPLRAEVARDEPFQAEVARDEPLRAEVARDEPLRAEVARAEPLRAEVARVESLRAEVVLVEPLRAEVARAEPLRAEVARAEPLRAEVARAESLRDDVPEPEAQAESISENEDVADDGDVHKSIENRNLAECIEDFIKDHDFIGSVVINILDLAKLFTNTNSYIMVIWMQFQTYFVYCLSKRLHKLSGGFDPETPEEGKERKALFHRLLRDFGVEYEKQHPLPPHVWIFDIVLDRWVAWSMKWGIAGKLIQFFVSRPVKPLEKISQMIKEILYERDQLVDYLKEDPDYDEKEDPDYQPDQREIVDDSLEYKDDVELQQDTEAGNNGHLNHRNASQKKTNSRGKNASLRRKFPAWKVKNHTLLTVDTSVKEFRNASPESKTLDVKRRSGAQTSSTPKDAGREKEKQGVSGNKTEEETEQVLSFEEEGTIILAPLCPEKFKQIETRDPVQAAVIRMKGDKIIEVKRKMREKKQERKLCKTKKKLIPKTTEYDVIHEFPESHEPPIELSDLQKSRETFDGTGRLVFQRERVENDEYAKTKTASPDCEESTEMEHNDVDTRSQQENEKASCYVTGTVSTVGATNSSSQDNVRNESPPTHDIPAMAAPDTIDIPTDANSETDAGQNASSIYKNDSLAKIAKEPKGIPQPMNQYDSKMDNGQNFASKSADNSLNEVSEEPGIISVLVNKSDSKAHDGQNQLPKSKARNRPNRTAKEPNDASVEATGMTTTEAKSQNSPDMSMICRDPGDQSREVLDSEFGAPSSSVDTGQTTSGW